MKLSEKMKLRLGRGFSTVSNDVFKDWIEECERMENLIEANLEIIWAKPKTPNRVGKPK